MMRRQPKELLRVAILKTLAPSNIPTWTYPRQAGVQFTPPQINLMRHWGLDLDTAEVIKVRITASQQDYWWPAGDPAPVFLFECPVIGSPRADGRVLVLSPGGERKLVWPDGYVRRPKHERRKAA